MAHLHVLNKANDADASEILKTANSLIREVIAEAEPLAYRLAREWGSPSRQQAMEDLMAKADSATAKLESYVQAEIIISHATSIMDCMKSLRQTAWHARSMANRAWGRAAIRASLEYLKKLFGDGCEFSTFSPHLRKESVSVLMHEPAKPPLPEYLSTVEVAKLLNVSRMTVVNQFANYPGVIDITLNTSKKFQKRRMLRIPRGVLLRFIEQHRVR